MSQLSTKTVALLKTSNYQPDITKPLLSVSFESTPPPPPTPAPPSSHPAQQDDFQVKHALVELGIMLLEIWHEHTLEEKCDLGPEPVRPS